MAHFKIVLFLWLSININSVKTRIFFTPDTVNKLLLPYFLSCHQIPTRINHGIQLHSIILSTTFRSSLTLTLPGPSAGVSGSLDSYCSLKPLCSGMGEVVPARTSDPRRPYFPHPLALCCNYPVSKCPSASIVVTSTVTVNECYGDFWPFLKAYIIRYRCILWISRHHIHVTVTVKAIKRFPPA